MKATIKGIPVQVLPMLEKPLYLIKLESLHRLSVDDFQVLTYELAKKELIKIDLNGEEKMVKVFDKLKFYTLENDADIETAKTPFTPKEKELLSMLEKVRKLSNEIQTPERDKSDITDIARNLRDIERIINSRVVKRNF